MCPTRHHKCLLPNVFPRVGEDVLVFPRFFVTDRSRRHPLDPNPRATLGQERRSILQQGSLAQRTRIEDPWLDKWHATTLLNLDTVGSDGKVPFERWRGRGHHMGRCVFWERVWYRVCPLTDRTKTEDRMESRILVGFRMKSSEYMLTVSGEAILASTIGR